MNRNEPPRRLIAQLAIGAVVLLAGCSHLNVLKVHDSFGGIRELYKSGNTLSLLVVHGMGEHDRGYSQGMQDGLAARLNMVATGSADVVHIAVNGYKLGSASRRVYRDDASKTLNVVELTWSDATTPIKRALLDLDKDSREKGFLEQHRLAVNSAAKAFVNTHFSDPVIYSGAFGATLRYTVSQAICILLSPGREWPSGVQCSFEQAGALPGEMAIVSSSMGSTLVFDSVVELFAGPSPQRAAAQRVVVGTKRIYMFANQLPLLDLREIANLSGPNWLDIYPCPDRNPVEAASLPPPRGLNAFLTLKRGLGAAQESLDSTLALNVVAFSDPNDLLTYEITDRFKNRCKPAKFANVTVTNAAKGWFFIAANPVVAHTAYGENARVLDLLVGGSAALNP